MFVFVLIVFSSSFFRSLPSFIHPHTGHVYRATSCGGDGIATLEHVCCDGPPYSRCSSVNGCTEKHAGILVLLFVVYSLLSVVFASLRAFVFTSRVIRIQITLRCGGHLKVCSQLLTAASELALVGLLLSSSSLSCFIALNECACMFVLCVCV